MPVEMTPEEIAHTRLRVKIDGMKINGVFTPGQIKYIAIVAERIQSFDNDTNAGHVHPDFTYAAGGVAAYVKGNQMIVEVKK